MEKKKVWITLGTVAVVGVSLFASVKLFGNTEPSAKQAMTDEIAVVEKDKKQTDSKKTEDKKVEEKKTEEKKTEEKTNSTLDEKKVEDKKVEDKKTEEKKEDDKKTSSKKIAVFDDEYEVKKGDTLFSIARTYLKDVDLAEAVSLIKEINHIDEKANILVGSKILIPTEENFKTAKVDGKGEAYKVQSGDTLTSIVKAKMSWCKPEDGLKKIMENNSINKPEDLKANQVIYIPTQK